MPLCKRLPGYLSDQVLLLPQKTKKTKSPEFDCNMLLIRSGNSVLLQKRPSKAIWGGLWSLPESAWKSRVLGSKEADLSSRELLEAAMPQEKTLALAKACKLLQKANEIKHVFTHRCLWMHIWQANCSKELALANPDLKWVPLNQLGRYGLPQPVKILLQGLSLVRGGDPKN